MGGFVDVVDELRPAVLGRRRRRRPEEEVEDGRPAAAGSRRRSMEWVTVAASSWPAY